MKSILMLKCLFVLFLFCPMFSFGQTFQAGNIARSGRYDDVCFINNNIGYTSFRGQLFKSTDGGNNWSFISKVDTNAAFKTYSRSIDFFDEDTGMIGTLTVNSFKGAIYRTTNKGLTWKKTLEVANLGEGVCGMAHYQNKVVAVGTYAGPAKVYISNNYGATFTTKDLSTLASALVDCYMVNKDTFFITGSSTTATNERPLILKTYDGGVNFSIVSALNLVSGYIWKIYFRPDGNGIASIENSFSTPSDSGFVMRTTDFGETWQSHSVDTVGNFGGVILLDNNVAFVGEQHNYGLWKSTNGGMNWTKIPFANDTTRANNRMILLPNNKIIVAGTYIYTSSGTTVGLNNHISDYYSEHSIKINPNLISNQQSIIKVELTAATSTMGVFVIYNLEGKVVYKEETGVYNKGTHEFSINTVSLDNGIYYAVWKTSENFVQAKFIKQ